MKIDSKKLKASLQSIQIKGKDELSKAYNKGVKASIKIIKVYERPTMYKYSVRHTENNWAKPYSIEPRVLVNFWGYAYSSTPLNFGKEGYLLVSKCKNIKLVEGR